MEKPIVGYLDIRGRVEVIRYMYHYLGVDFEDRRYSYDQWLNEKRSLGLDFPNLPYLIDGSLRITQRIAIHRYIARKYDLNGKTEAEQIRLELAEQHLIDLSGKLSNMCYNAPDFNSARQEYLQTLPSELQRLEQFLGCGQYVIGDRITYVDFMLYNVLDLNQLFEPGVLDNFSRLKEFVRRIEALPTLAKYLNSSEYPRFRVFAKIAKWSGPQS